GGGAAGGLLEGGSDELEALVSRRAWSSWSRRSRCAMRICSAAMRPSRWTHPGQLDSLIHAVYQNRRQPAIPPAEKRWAVTDGVRAPVGGNLFPGHPMIVSAPERPSDIAHVDHPIPLRRVAWAWPVSHGGDLLFAEFRPRPPVRS